MRMSRGWTRTAAVWVVAGTGAACATTVEPEPDPVLIRQVVNRIAATETLRGNDYQANLGVLAYDLRSVSVPILLRSVRDDPSPRVRASCALALGKAQDPRAVPVLAESLEEDENDGVRLTAAYNLCLFRDPRGIPALVAALRHEEPFHRVDAAQRLHVLTGLDFGYQGVSEPAERESAVRRWEEWLEREGPERAAAAIQLR